MKLLVRIFIFVLSFTLSFLSAQQIPEQKRDVLAYDFAGLLKPEQLQALQNKLLKFRDSSEHKLVLVIVKDLQGYTVEEFANKLFNTWKIGKKDFNNGILLLVSKDDHKVRFEVGYGMEAAFTDIESKHIIEDNIVPYFKEKMFYDGIDSGIQATIDHLNKSPDTPVVPKKTISEEKKSFYANTVPGGNVVSFILPAFLFFAFYIGMGIYLLRAGAKVRDYFKWIGIGIGGYIAGMLLIDVVCIALYDGPDKTSFGDAFGDYFAMRTFVGIFYSIFILIPVAIILLIIKAIFFTKYSGSTFSSSSSSSYSDYSDSSKSYSDYSDYSDSYSDYSDYSDSGGSSGGGGSSGSW